MHPDPSYIQLPGMGICKRNYEDIPVMQLGRFGVQC